VAPANQTSAFVSIAPESGGANRTLGSNVRLCFRIADLDRFYRVFDPNGNQVSAGQAQITGQTDCITARFDRTGIITYKIEAANTSNGPAVGTATYSFVVN